MHIPFCKKKCDYCDFVSYSNKEDEIKAYFDAMEREINSYNLENYNVTTIYIGGGTPSFVDSKYICNIIETIKNKIKENDTSFDNIEITIEANPGSITEEKLKMYKKIGINRISIGLQSTNDILLKQIGRIHTYKDFLNSYELVKKAGFKNINVDLIIGLPNQTIENLKSDLTEIKKLNPNHVSIYSLIIEDGTKIQEDIEKRKIRVT